MFPEDIADIIYSNISDDCSSCQDVFVYFGIGPHDTHRQYVLCRLAAGCGYVEMLQKICTNQRVDNDYIYLLSCQWGRLPVVHWLLKCQKCHPIIKAHRCASGFVGYPCSIQRGGNFICAAQSGHVDVIRLLLTYESFDFVIDQALELTTWTAHTKMLKLLLPLSTIEIERVLLWGISNNNIECVKIALQGDDKSWMYNDHMLRKALSSNNKEIIELLRQDDRVWHRIVYLIKTRNV